MSKITESRLQTIISMINTPRTFTFGEALDACFCRFWDIWRLPANKKRR